MQDIRIIALDLGTHCGYAVGNPTEIIYSGVIDLLPNRWEGGGHRFLRFRQQLQAWRAAMPDNALRVHYEAVKSHRGTAAAHCYGGLLGILTGWCEENRVPYMGHSVQAIKQAVTGKGNATKAEVIASVQALGYAIKDDNEADAIALYHLALETDFAKPVQS